MFGNDGTEMTAPCSGTVNMVDLIFAMSSQQRSGYVTGL
jgi:hypothetical protein